MTCVSCSPRKLPGAVLLLVLCAVAILTVLAIEVAHRARVDVQRGQRMARDLVFKRAFDSGGATARGLLLESRKNSAFDYFGDGWSKPVSLDLMDGPTIHIQVYDESGKLNLLKLRGQPGVTDTSDRTVTRLFTYMRKHDAMHSDQWKDAETNLRRRLGMSIANEKSDANNANPASIAPILTLDGLREAGVPTELIFGKGYDASGKTGLALCDVMTTFGDGLINLNTAHEGVLYSLAVEYDDPQVDLISSWRGLRSDDGSGDFKAFQIPKDLEHVQGIVRKPSSTDPSAPDENLFAKVQDHLSVRSACFSAKIEVVFGMQRRLGWVFFDVYQPSVGDTGTYDLKVLAFEEIEP